MGNAREQSYTGEACWEHDSAETSEPAVDRSCGCSWGSQAVQRQAPVSTAAFPCRQALLITRALLPHWIRGAARELRDACLMFNIPGSW